MEMLRVSNQLMQMMQINTSQKVAKLSAGFAFHSGSQILSSMEPGLNGISQSACLLSHLLTSDPLWSTDCDSFIHGIFRARILEWVLPFPPPGDLPNLHLLHLLHWQMDSLPLHPLGSSIPQSSFPLTRTWHFGDWCKANTVSRTYFQSWTLSCWELRRIGNRFILL